MEADWEFEIGTGAPVIDADWSGFVDLRADPSRVAELPEAHDVPGLAVVLPCLNSASSPVFTSKCDVWRPDAIDADELGATSASAACALACYIDLLPGHPDAWSSPDSIDAWCRRLTVALRPIPLPDCRIDLVVRRAFYTRDRDSLAVTVYFTACAAKENEAAENLSAALVLFADTLQALPPSGATAQTLQ